MTDARTRDNYAYWQEHGGEWVDIYRERKTHLVYYHLQELMIVDYVERNRAANVLEIGMGVGRHVRNLQRVTDTYGFDQSPTMFEAVRATTDPAWFDTHCTLGTPMAPLPYPDDAFDVVFTSEVLVHVHPDDLPRLLSEMVRVSRWQVFHLEPSSADWIVSSDHDGCWYHDLPAVYERLGLRCETLPAGYTSQTPFRVVLDESRPAAVWPESHLALWRTMEHDLQPVLDSGGTSGALAAMTADRDRLWSEVQMWSAHAGELGRAVADADARHRAVLDDAQQLRGLLVQTGRERDTAAAEADRLRRVVEAVDELPGGRLLRSRAERRAAPPAPVERALGAGELGLSAVEATPLPGIGGDATEVWLLDVVNPDGGLTDLRAIPAVHGWQRVPSEHSRNGVALAGEPGAAELVLRTHPDAVLRLLQHPWSGIARVRRAHGAPEQATLTSESTGVLELPVAGVPRGALSGLHGVLTDADGATERLDADAWFATVAARRPAAVGLCHPSWFGIRSSMQNLFSAVLLLDDSLRPDEVDALAERLAATGVPAVATGGFPRSYRPLVEALRRHGVRTAVTWHGSFLQMGEGYNRSALDEVLALAKDGLVDKVGFVKVGMAGAYEKLGFPVTTVLNYVRGAPVAPLRRSDALERVGIWSVAPVWRKIPYAMLAACSQVDPRPVVYASGRDPVLADLADDLAVDLRLVGSAVPHEAMPTWLGSMDLNLYVTLSECAPMLPLESLDAGVPCLLGPNAHYFDDDDYLRSRLVVGEPDRHERIAAAMARAFAERDEIIAHYRDVFLQPYVRAARQSVRDLVDAPEGSDV